MTVKGYMSQVSSPTGVSHQPEHVTHMIMYVTLDSRIHSLPHFILSYDINVWWIATRNLWFKVADDSLASDHKAWGGGGACRQAGGKHSTLFIYLFVRPL